MRKGAPHAYPFGSPIPEGFIALHLLLSQPSPPREWRGPGGRGWPRFGPSPPHTSKSTPPNRPSGLQEARPAGGGATVHGEPRGPQSGRGGARVSVPAASRSLCAGRSQPPADWHSALRAIRLSHYASGRPQPGWLQR